jgi:hypothetical protein
MFNGSFPLPPAGTGFGVILAGPLLAVVVACSSGLGAKDDLAGADTQPDDALEGFPNEATRACCRAHSDVCRDFLALDPSYSVAQCGGNSGCTRKPDPSGPQGCYCLLCIDERCLSAECID